MEAADLLLILPFRRKWSGAPDYRQHAAASSCARIGSFQSVKRLLLNSRIFFFGCRVG